MDRVSVWEDKVQRQAVVMVHNIANGLTAMKPYTPN
jgi:hypothetical protein